MDSKVEILCTYFMAFIKAHHGLQYEKHIVKGIVPLNDGVRIRLHSLGGYHQRPQMEMAFKQQ